MSNLLVSAANTRNKKRLLGLLLVILGGLLCIGREHENRHINRKYLGIDFRAVYGSSRCVIENCNPYYYADMRAQFLKQGGTEAEALTPKYGPFMPYYVGYPPPTLFYFVPFAMLRWPLAWFVYMALAIALYALAALLFADLCSEYVPLAASACLALFVAIEGDIIVFGQPTLLAAGLLCIGIWCLLKNRYPRVGVVCFAFSLIIKPHLGALVLLYFLVATPNYRKRAFQVILLTVLLCVPALMWFSAHDAMRHWVQDYRANLTGIATPGNLSDPGPRHKGENHITDLQAIVSLYRDEPAFYNHVSWAISGVLLALWLYPAIRRPASQEKDILCITAIATLSMLPIYHRLYDCRILLVMFPALALLRQRTQWGRWATIVTVSATLIFSHFYTFNSDTHKVQRLANYPVLQAPLIRAVPLALLVLTIFYLVVLYVYPSGIMEDPECLQEGKLEPIAS